MIENPLELYRALRLPRTVEEKMLRLIRQSRIAKWFSGFGQEAIAVGVTSALNDDDTLLPMHRNLGVWTTRGLPLDRLFAQLMGKQGGYTNGRDRTFHFGTLDHNIVGMISQLAAMLPVACGYGLAAQLKGEKRVAAAWIGDGATREGDFHEALSIAGIWKLPVIFILENNGYGLSTPTSEALPVKDLAKAAAGYGIKSEIVDGNDVFAVQKAVKRAANRARRGNGATLLEMKTFRLRGHEEASGIKYVPKELIAEWEKKDPIIRMRTQLIADQVATEAELDAIDAELKAQIEKLTEEAIVQPEIVSDMATELDAIFAKDDSVMIPPAGGKTKKRFIDALTDGLHHALKSDEKVMIMGQDIAEYGGVFKLTNGFVEEFGKARIRNTPIIESGIVGTALGLALEGFKPIVEIQYADFITCGFNQIVNNLATTHYRWGEPVNVTIRAPFGGHIGAGPFHSQSPEAWFCHTPGLKVIIPGTPEDAKGLLLSAIDDPNPVLFFEHKFLYRSLKEDVTDAAFKIPIGKAKVVREGSDVTLVTWGIGLRWALEEADRQAEKGKSVEVIDLRTLIPWDKEAVMASVQKTNRLMVLHEATGTAGFGAEVVAEITECSFRYLDAPPTRVTSKDMPVPFANQLEKEIFTAQCRLAPAMDELLAY